MSHPWILVPALGTDERLFWPLLTATGWANVRVMPLPHPLAATQLSAYARLLATGLPPAGEYNLLGVSFGASVAVEVALVRPPAQLVVVSGAKTVRELPPWVRLAPHLLRHPQFRPEWLRALAQPEWMGIRESTERQLFRDMLAGTPTRLLHWAFNALGTWSNHVTPPRTLHLHGTADLLLPAAFAHGSQKIRGAGHWAIFTHAPEIARHIGG